jgi:hypothetical protein
LTTRVSDSSADGTRKVKWAGIVSSARAGVRQAKTNIAAPSQ